MAVRPAMVFFATEYIFSAMSIFVIVALQIIGFHNLSQIFFGPRPGLNRFYHHWAVDQIGWVREKD